MKLPVPDCNHGSPADQPEAWHNVLGVSAPAGVDEISAMIQVRAA